jgi:hypothetical protein
MVNGVNNMKLAAAWVACEGLSESSSAFLPVLHLNYAKLNYSFTHSYSSLPSQNLCLVVHHIHLVQSHMH